jgi:hypothetical protein
VYLLEFCYVASPKRREEKTPLSWDTNGKNERRGQERDVMSTDDQCEESGELTSGGSTKQNTMSSQWALPEF